MKATAGLQRGGPVQNCHQLRSLTTVSPTWMNDFNQHRSLLEGRWLSMLGSHHPTCPFPPGDKERTGRERDGGWTFFSIKEQRLDKSLVGIAIFSFGRWREQCLLGP